MKKYSKYDQGIIDECDNITSDVNIDVKQDKIGQLCQETHRNLLKLHSMLVTNQEWLRDEEYIGDKEFKMIDDVDDYIAWLAAQFGH